jgi:hypothetical protein
MEGASAPRLPNYARTRAALRRGLDGVLLAASARPVGQAARGFIVELLARHPSWHRDGRQRAQVGSGDATP